MVGDGAVRKVVGRSEIFRYARKMRSPDSHSSSSLASASAERALLLGEDLGEVPTMVGGGLQFVAGGLEIDFRGYQLVLFLKLVLLPLASARSFGEGVALGGSGSGGGGGDGAEEVDVPALELRVGGQDDDADALRAVLPEDVLRIGLHDIAGADVAAHLLHETVGVHDPHHVQRPARQHARYAASQAVPHLFFFVALLLRLYSTREKGEMEVLRRIMRSSGDGGCFANGEREE